MISRGLGLLFLAAIGCAPARGPAPSPIKVEALPPPVSDAPADLQEPEPRVVESTAPQDDRLEVLDISIGTGTTALPTSTVEVHYVGTLDDGAEFDSTRSRGQPFRVELGKHALIEGFERAVVGMRAGGIRRVRIPHELAYGERGVPGKIPPGAALTFEIELLGVW